MPVKATTAKQRQYYSTMALRNCYNVTTQLRGCIFLGLRDYIYTCRQLYPAQGRCKQRVRSSMYVRPAPNQWHINIQ